MDAPIHEDVRDLHAHIRATEERPLTTEANRWLGEAQAVAGDAVGPNVSETVVEKRVGQVADLLSHVDGTGDPVADEHVAEARDIAERVLVRLDG